MKLALRQLFRGPTVSALAAEITQQQQDLGATSGTPSSTRAELPIKPGLEGFDLGPSAKTASCSAQETQHEGVVALGRVRTAADGRKPARRELRIGTLAAGLLKTRAHATDFLLDVKTLLNQRDLRVHGPRVVDSDEGGPNSCLFPTSSTGQRDVTCAIAWTSVSATSPTTSSVRTCAGRTHREASAPAATPGATRRQRPQAIGATVNNKAAAPGARRDVAVQQPARAAGPRHWWSNPGRRGAGGEPWPPTARGLGVEMPRPERRGTPRRPSRAGPPTRGPRAAKSNIQRAIAIRPATSGPKIAGSRATKT